MLIISLYMEGEYPITMDLFENILTLYKRISANSEEYMDIH